MVDELELDFSMYDSERHFLDDIRHQQRIEELEEQVRCLTARARKVERGAAKLYLGLSRQDKNVN